MTPSAKKKVPRFNKENIGFVERFSSYNIEMQPFSVLKNDPTLFPSALSTKTSLQCSRRLLQCSRRYYQRCHRVGLVVRSRREPANLGRRPCIVLGAFPQSSRGMSHRECPLRRRLRKHGHRSNNLPSRTQGERKGRRRKDIRERIRKRRKGNNQKNDKEKDE